MNALQTMELELTEIMVDMMVETELSGKEEKVYSCSLATISDSGISFGRCQFDVKNNSTAQRILKGLGFTEEDIEWAASIQDLEDPMVSQIDQKLRSKLGRDLIDNADRMRANWCVRNVQEVFNKDEDLFHVEQFCHLADMANQYGRFTNPGKTRTWFDSKRYHENKDIDRWCQAFKQFKLNQTKHGRDFPWDVERRYEEIRAFFEAHKQYV